MSWVVVLGAWAVLFICLAVLSAPHERKPRVDYAKIERLEIELGIVEAPPSSVHNIVVKDCYFAESGMVQVLPHRGAYAGRPAYEPTMGPLAAITRDLTDSEWAKLAKRYAKQAHRREQRA